MKVPLINKGIYITLIISKTWCKTYYITSYTTYPVWVLKGRKILGLPSVTYPRSLFKSIFKSCYLWKKPSIWLFDAHPYSPWSRSTRCSFSSPLLHGGLDALSLPCFGHIPILSHEEAMGEMCSDLLDTHYFRGYLYRCPCPAISVLDGIMYMYSDISMHLSLWHVFMMITSFYSFGL